MGSVLNKFRVWSLNLVSFLVGLKTYQHPLLCCNFIHQMLVLFLPRYMTGFLKFLPGKMPRWYFEIGYIHSHYRFWLSTINCCLSPYYQLLFLIISCKILTLHLVQLKLKVMSCFFQTPPNECLQGDAGRV